MIREEKEEEEKKKIRRRGVKHKANASKQISINIYRKHIFNFYLSKTIQIKENLVYFRLF